MPGEQEPQQARNQDLQDPQVLDLLEGLSRPSTAEIYALRKAHGLSQEELGRIMGYGRRDRVSEFERGEHSLPIERWALALLATGRHPRLRLQVISPSAE